MGITLERAQEMILSNPHTDETLAFINKGPSPEETDSREKVKALKKGKLGVPTRPTLRR